jgi:hypothetical protein
MDRSIRKVTNAIFSSGLGKFYLANKTTFLVIKKQVGGGNPLLVF